MSRVNKGVVAYGPLFQECAGLPAIDWHIEKTRKELARIERRMAMLVALREKRIKQIEAGEWP